MASTNEGSIQWPGWVYPEGTVVIITGAGSGIGQATTVLAAQQGLHVAAWDLNLDGVQRTVELAGEDGQSILPVKVNVTDQAAVALAMQQTVQFGKPSLLVNNAGPVALGRQWDFTEGLVAAVGSVHLVTQAFLATDPPAGQSSIVNISSVAGILVGGGAAWYAAAKAAIVGYTKNLAAEMGRRCRVNVIAPGGPIATPRNQAFLSGPEFQATLERNPMGRPGRPEELAAAILFLISPAASYINGSLLVVDGGLTIAE